MKRKEGKIGIILTLLLAGMLTLAFNIQQVKASGTIYIRADGSIDPSIAPIQRNGDIFTLTDNITSDADGVVIERNNLVLDGAGYTVQNTGLYWDSKGIDLTGRNNVTIKNVTIKTFCNGVLLNYSSNNSIVGNNITANNWYGVLLESSSNNSITGNMFTNDGLGITGSHGSYRNVVEDNLVNDKPLVYFESVSGFKIENAGQVILINCDSIHVENLNLSRVSVGIELWNTTNTKIAGNNITDNSCGVYLSYSSEYNSITGNNIADNRNGILSEWQSKYNNITGNSMINNGVGILLDDSFYNIIIGNNITKSSYYGIYFPSDANYNIITGNNITKNSRGIFFDSNSNYNWVIGNNITNNGDGIYWYWRFSNDNNKFYHNNFINNTNQIDNRLEDRTVNIWDNGYPSGGNYWSNYRDKYPNATEIDDSGIWNTPYVIDENNQDNYPLMNPYTLEMVIVDNIPPEIGTPMQEPSENIEAYQNVTVSVNVTDFGSGIQNVTLWYAINNGTTWIPLNMTEISTGTYQAIIPGYEKDQWIQYKIIAFDNNANQAINDNHGYCYTYPVIPEFLPVLFLPLSIVTTLFAVIFRRRKNPFSVR
jgi:parallel beta-helix repeat protein